MPKHKQNKIDIECGNKTNRVKNRKPNTNFSVTQPYRKLELDKPSERMKKMKLLPGWMPVCLHMKIGTRYFVLTFVGARSVFIARDQVDKFFFVSSSFSLFVPATVVVWLEHTRECKIRTRYCCSINDDVNVDTYRWRWRRRQLFHDSVVFICVACVFARTSILTAASRWTTTKRTWQREPNE